MSWTTTGGKPTKLPTEDDNETNCINLSSVAIPPDGLSFVFILFHSGKLILRQIKPGHHKKPERNLLSRATTTVSPHRCSSSRRAFSLCSLCSFSFWSHSASSPFAPTSSSPPPAPGPLGFVVNAPPPGGAANGEESPAEGVSNGRGCACTVAGFPAAGLVWAGFPTPGDAPLSFPAAILACACSPDHGFISTYDRSVGVLEGCGCGHNELAASTASFG